MPAQPVGVVEEQGAAVLQVEELAELGADALEVALDRLEVEQLALVLLAAGVADHAGAAAGEGDRPVTRLLEPPERAQLQEVAHVEAVRRRVEPGVDGEAGVVEPLRQLGVGHLVDQAAEGEVLRQRGHDPTLPYAGRLIGRMVIGVSTRAGAADGGRVASGPAGDAVPGWAAAGGGGAEWRGWWRGGAGGGGGGRWAGEGGAGGGDGDEGRRASLVGRCMRSSSVTARPSPTCGVSPRPTPGCSGTPARCWRSPKPASRRGIPGSSNPRSSPER